MGLTVRERRGWCGILALLLALAAPIPRAGAEATRIELLALNGYDPVSYFMPDGPQAGSPRLEAGWGGRAWRFAIESNRAAFRRDPAVYAPRLGGYDAAAVLEHRIVGADPTVFAILDGRLYLFRDGERRARFLADPALARQAEAAWPELTRLLEDPGETRSAPAVPVSPLSADAPKTGAH
jgi:hypothetical protein